jgi:primosomal protein N'
MTPSPACPRCGAAPLQRSRTRTLLDRVRKTLTSDRPHRCVSCGWRGWTAVGAGAGRAARAVIECDPPQLEAIDHALSGKERFAKSDH